MPGTKRCPPPPRGPFPGRLPAPHPPLPHPAPPVIPGDTEELVEEVTVNASSTVSLQCPALGNPMPTISWLQNGLPFSPSPRLQVLEDGRVLQVRAPPAVAKGSSCRGSVLLAWDQELPLPEPSEVPAREPAGAPGLRPPPVMRVHHHHVPHGQARASVAPGNSADVTPTASAAQGPGQHLGHPVSRRSCPGPLHLNTAEGSLLRAGGDHRICYRGSPSPTSHSSPECHRKP